MLKLKRLNQVSKLKKFNHKLLKLNNSLPKEHSTIKSCIIQNDFTEGLQLNHDYKLERDAHCSGNPKHELKSGTKITFDSFGQPHCPVCNASVIYSW